MSSRKKPPVAAPDPALAPSVLQSLPPAPTSPLIVSPPAPPANSVPPPVSLTSPPAAPPPSAPESTPAPASAPSPSSVLPAAERKSPPAPPSQPSVSPSPPQVLSPPALSPPPPSKPANVSPSRPLVSSPPPPVSRSPTSTTPSSSPPPPPSSSTAISGGSLIAIGIAAVFAFSVLSVLCYCLCRTKKKRYYPADYYNTNGGPHQYKDPYYSADMRRQQEWCSPSSEMLMKAPSNVASFSTNHGYDPIPPPPKGGSPGLGNSKSWFTYQELATATGGFAQANALGEGGFGCVYKGTLANGQLVAVKQLKAGASQGEREFRAEVEIISRVHHRHLVSLVGYCIAESQRLLVYDYVPNGTLEYHLHNKQDGSVMDWPTRLKIACGAARGLAYLHEDCHPRIIHRDIKSSNILLDDNFEAQVSDFGLAKSNSDMNTHVTTRVMGTFGYLAPEYASSGKLTDKSDVFSFGVVLLELLTGRKPVDTSQPPGEESLVEWARPVFAQLNGEEDLLQIADPALEGAFDSREMMRMVEAAAACVRHSANKRPRMAQVVRALEDDSSISDLGRGHKLGVSGAFGSSFGGMSDYENGSYSADMRKYMRVALETQEFGSEYSGATSEYGLNASNSSGEFRASREMTDRSVSQQYRRETMDSNSGPQSRKEMPERSHSSIPASMRANIMDFNTQAFRLGN